MARQVQYQHALLCELDYDDDILTPAWPGSPVAWRHKLPGALTTAMAGLSWAVLDPGQAYTFGVFRHGKYVHGRTPVPSIAHKVWLRAKEGKYLACFGLAIHAFTGGPQEFLHGLDLPDDLGPWMPRRDPETYNRLWHRSYGGLLLRECFTAPSAADAMIQTALFYHGTCVPTLRLASLCSPQVSADEFVSLLAFAREQPFTSQSGVQRIQFLD